MRRCRTAVSLVTIALAVVGGRADAAPHPGADRGVAIDTSRIDVDEVLDPGAAYRLPSFGIHNPGTEPTTYRLVVQPGDSSITTADEDWFRFSPAEITLGGGQSHPVSVALTIPPGAAEGDYDVLVGPQIVDDAEGTRVGAIAAAHVTFAVSSSNSLAAWWRWLLRALGDRPWVWITAVLLAVVAGARGFRQRFVVTIGRRTGP